LDLSLDVAGKEIGLELQKHKIYHVFAKAWIPEEAGKATVY
jgi:hypothetical protein